MVAANDHSAALPALNPAPARPARPVATGV